MIAYIAVQTFDQTPLGVTLIGLACTALMTIALAAVKIAFQVNTIQAEIKAMRDDIEDLKKDSDIMRWSVYSSSATHRQYGERNERRR